LKFESKLAGRIVQRKNGHKGWFAIFGAVFAVFLVLNVTSGSIAGDHAVIQLGSKSSVARYLGQFDGKSNVIMLGAISSLDWVCVKIPFKGHLSDVKSIAFSEFVAQSGGLEALEPFVVIKLTEGRSLACDPVSSYPRGVWDLPLLEWQLRDTVSKGSWIYATPDSKSASAPLGTWIGTIGDPNVLGISLLMGHWNISSTYQCYIGDLAVNGNLVGLSNAARCCGSLSDLPPGF